jgi:hypothetical protein
MSAGAAKTAENENLIALEETSFLYEAPLLRHQSPVGGRGALGYNDSDLRENG